MFREIIEETGIDADSFTADVTHETLPCSTLGCLAPGERVNLERAMPAGGRFGGHIVSGHIDGVGTIIRRKKRGNGECRLSPFGICRTTANVMKLWWNVWRRPNSPQNMACLPLTDIGTGSTENITLLW